MVATHAGHGVIGVIKLFPSIVALRDALQREGRISEVPAPYFLRQRLQHQHSEDGLASRYCITALTVQSLGESIQFPNVTVQGRGQSVLRIPIAGRFMANGEL